MKKFLFLLFLLPALCLSSFSYGEVTNPILEFTESDSSPSTFPFRVLVSNGTLTDNGDGSASLTTGGGGGGGLSITGTAPNSNVRVSSGNTLAGDTLIVSDGSNLSVGVSTTANASRLYIRGSGTDGATSLILRVASSTPTDRLVIRDDGNVGIGTTAPGAPLYVLKQNGAAASTVKIEDTDGGAFGPTLTLYHNSASPAANDIVGRWQMNANDSLGNENFAAYIDFVWTNPASATKTSRIVFHTRNGATDNSAMTINHSGNVGIGTTAPTLLLQVDKNQNSATTVGVVNANAGTAAYASVVVGMTPGTGTDLGALEHFGSGYTANGLYAPSTTVLEGDDTGGLTLLSQNASAPMRFATGGYLQANERMRILSGGNVGIGTTAPNSLLDVQGGQSVKRTAIAASYTAVNADLIIGVTSTGSAITVTLPSAVTSGAGKLFYVKDESGLAATNNITVNSVSGNIDGATSKVISSNYGSLSLYGDATNWFIF